MSIWSFIEINSFIKAIGGFVEFGGIVVVIFQINSVVFLWYLDWFVYLAIALADLAV